MVNYDERLHTADIHWPCSISVVGKKVYDTTWPILKRILRDQGRSNGKGNTFATADAYKQYEHCIDRGYGEKYDIEFFEGLIVTPERKARAAQEYRADQDYEAREKARRVREYQQEQERKNAQQNGRAGQSAKDPAGGIVGRLLRFLGR